MKPNSMIVTSAQDTHNDEKWYIHISIYRGKLSLEERNEILTWVNTKFPTPGNASGIPVEANP